MPKYLQTCNCHFHEQRKSSGGDLQVLNLGKNGLSELANTFVKFLKAELGIKSPAVVNVCTDCLRGCMKKRVFTKHIPPNIVRTIENKEDHDLSFNVVVPAEENATISVGSQSSSQVSEVTITVSSPSQKLEDSEQSDDVGVTEWAKTFKEKEIQTDDNYIFNSKDDYEALLQRTLKQFGISEQGLASLRNLGVAAHPRTIQAAAQSSATFHLNIVAEFFQEVVQNEHFLVFCIDDYHNIHTMHRPEAKTQTQQVHMATLLVKVFPKV
ncbi:Hypothetical predicted protein [Paramuricea clavata]|uniref:Uncharacterized protein n=1 Tax=Paramuricea clavata TaxID=317549 RepID=A0A7D9DMD2_PARCT|nr:Hypothetical predicted protein [Paramuricea clavata]